MIKPTLTLVCLAGTASLAFGNLYPLSSATGKAPVRPISQISRNHHVFQEDVQTDEESYDIFYDQLADDGQWYYDDTYGYVFQPAVAADSTDWRPYSDGHWEDTDRGWYWDSNERFGWATYHYGRWVLVDGTGWVWVPGNEWAPSWVSWRDSDDYCGWAPLPPDCGSVSVGVSIGGWCDSYWGVGPSWYCFLPWRSWHSHSYAGAFAPYSQNVTIINNTRNVTNIYNNNNVINNFGPQPQQVALKTNQQIPKYNINYVAQNDPRAFKATKSGNQLSVIGPKPNLKTVATQPPNVAKTLANTKANKGWNSVNANQATNLKTKFAQQNPVPGNLPKTTNALVKPTIIGGKGTGANNPPGGNKGAVNNSVAANKGAGNGLLANQNNANAGGANNRGAGPNNLKAFKGANTPNNKGAQGTGGGNNPIGNNNSIGGTNKGAGSSNLKAFKGTTNSSSNKGTKGAGGGNNAGVSKTATGSSQPKSFKSSSTTSNYKGAKGPGGGGNHNSPNTLKKSATGGSSYHPKASYQPKPTYHPPSNTYHPPANAYHPSGGGGHPSGGGGHPSGGGGHPSAVGGHPSGGGGGNKGGGGGNGKDKKKN
jgi:hypothetical protein